VLSSPDAAAFCRDDEQNVNNNASLFSLGWVSTKSGSTETRYSIDGLAPERFANSGFFYTESH
jgi:hypothetical protein